MELYLKEERALSEEQHSEYHIEEEINSIFNSEIVNAMEATEDITFIIEDLVNDDDPWQSASKNKSVRLMLVATIGALALKFGDASEKLMEYEDEES
jgi:hypothetical protein